MKSSMSWSGETFDHKVAAVFPTGPEAEIAARAIRESTSLADGQITILRPNDREADRKLEPESRGIWHTLVHSHLWLGALGAVVGLMLFLVLGAVGIDSVALNAWVAAAAMAAYGAVVGLLLAGAVTLRPDHMPYVMAAQSALKKGNFVLTVHASSLHQLEEAQDVLKKRHISSIRTL